MNVNNNLNPVDYWFNNVEVLKHNEDLKQIVFNEEGTYIAILSKISEIIIYDVIAKCTLMVISDYISNEIRNISIISIKWSTESSSLFVAFKQENLISDSNAVEEEKITEDLEPGEIKLSTKTKKNVSEKTSPFHCIDEIVFQTFMNQNNTNTCVWKSYFINSLLNDLNNISIDSLYLEKNYSINKHHESQIIRRDKRILVCGSNPCIIELENTSSCFLFDINLLNNDIHDLRMTFEKINDNSKNTESKRKGNNNNNNNNNNNTNTNQNNQLENYTFYLKDIRQLINNNSEFSKSYLLIIKEIFLMMVIKDNEINEKETQHDIKNFKNLNFFQKSIFGSIQKLLSKKFRIAHCLDENFNTEIISFDMDLSNTVKPYIPYTNLYACYF